jgi:hypothetical protein
MSALRSRGRLNVRVWAWVLAAALAAAVVLITVPWVGQRHWARVAHAQSQWSPAWSKPLSDAQAAALVTLHPEERPANATANEDTPSESQLRAFRDAKNSAGESAVRWNPLFAYVTGRPGITRPSTDDLIQWAAHKWGIPEDLIRAQMTVESDLDMGKLGDRRAVGARWYAQYPPSARVVGADDVYESMGIAQVKWIPDGSVGAGTEPLRRQSTAFNLEFYAASLRYYYDGLCTWCGPSYRAGQAWNSVGAWFSPHPWGNAQALGYVRDVQRILREVKGRDGSSHPAALVGSTASSPGRP